MDESSEITGSFHFANKASLQAHFILVETESGMQTIDQSIFKLFKAGKITTQQAIQHADSSNNMRLLIKMDGHQDGGNDDGFGDLTIAQD